MFKERSSVYIYSGMPLCIWDEDTNYALVNLTPREIHIYLEDEPKKDPDFIVPRSGIIINVKQKIQVDIMKLGKIPVCSPLEYTGIDTSDFNTGIGTPDFNTIIETPDFNTLIKGPPKNRALIVTREAAKFLKNSGVRWPGGIFTTSGQGRVIDHRGYVITNKLEVWVLPTP